MKNKDSIKSLDMEPALYSTPAKIYLLSVFFIGAIGYTPWVLSSYGLILFSPLYVYIGGLSPLFAAIIASKYSYGKRGLKYTFDQLTLHFKVGKCYTILAIGITITIQFISMLLYSLLSNPVDFRSFFYIEFIPAIIVFSFYAMGEEFGWRSFLLPHFQEKFSVFSASIIVGLYWALWHWPHFLLQNGTMLDLYGNYWYFLLYLMLNSLYYSWFYHKSRANVLTCVILHGTENAMIAVIPLNVFVYIFLLKTIIVVILLVVFRNDFFLREKSIGYSQVQLWIDQKRENENRKCCDLGEKILF